MKKLLLFALSISMAATLVACQPLESSARDGIAAFRGYLVSAVQRHSQECVTSDGQAEYCQSLVKAAYAENAAVTALESYCQFPANTVAVAVAKGVPDPACQPVKAAAPALKAALLNLNQLSAEIKKAAQ